MSSNTIFVTGGAGYIGSHICKAIAASGYEPIVIDSLARGHFDAVKWGRLIECNLLDTEALEQAFETFNPLAVLHVAAYAYVGESVKEPGLYHSNNVSGSISLLETMRRFNCRKIVFTSSCSVYGAPDRGHISECTAKTPVNPYGAGKLMVETIIKDYCRAYGFESVSFQCFNVAGADPEGEIGEVHDPETHLIPIILDVALGKRSCFDIMGVDYPTEDGTCIRDFVHVSDVAQAVLIALKQLLDGGDGGIYNLASGTGYSVREIISHV